MLNQKSLPLSDAREEYTRSGVDVFAFNRFVHRLKDGASRTGLTSERALSGFGAEFDPKAAGLVDPIFITACDGVGTKICLAHRAGKHDTIGIDLVAMCVNDLVCHGARPLNFLDYIACGKLDEDVLGEVIEGIVEGCRQCEAVLVGGETAEMPGVYKNDVYELAGFAFGAFERGNGLPDLPSTKAGDVVIGLQSSGLHSNGFSLINRIAKDVGGLDETFPSQRGANHTLADELLTPTRIYTKAIIAALSKAPKAIRAVAHITGGGIAENLQRVLPDNLSAQIDLATIKVPEIYRWVSQRGNIRLNSMHTTFNCGLGMAVVVSANKANEVLDILSDSGETVWRIGEIIPHAPNGSKIDIVGNLELPALN